jgi:hypothetical protein
MAQDIQQLSFDEWEPGPFCDIAIINRTIESLVSEHGFSPERVVEDGLGWVSYIPLQVGDGTRFMLFWGEAGNPEQVSVFADITDRPYSAAIDKLLAALGLDRSVVLWLSDDDGYIHLLESLKREGKLA